METLIEHAKKLFVCPECEDNLLFIGSSCDGDGNMILSGHCVALPDKCETAWDFKITIKEAL